MSSLCRACLAGNVKMYSLEKNILEIYEKLTNTKMITSKPLVCYICHWLLQRCVRFSEMAHYSENMLQDLHDKGIEISHKNTLRNPTKDHLSQSPIHITDVNGEFMDNSINNVTVKQEPNTCEDIVTIKAEFIKVESIEVEVDPQPYLMEALTDHEGNSKSNIEGNISHTSHHDEKLEKKELLDNIEPQLTYNYDLCNKVLFTKSSLSRQVTSHSGVKPYACVKCPKTFTKKYAMKGHMQIHSEEKPFKCEMCDKTFSRKSYLAKHVKAHGDMPAQCNICNKSFSRKIYLKAHVKIHNGLGSYACDNCDKKFYYKSSLIKHMKTHTNSIQARPFPCDLCDKSFSFKCGLVNHKMTHTREKPYACGVCNQKFAQKPNLNVHMRIHTGEKPYACVMCDKKFSLKSVLKNHERTHTGERPYPCDKCHMKFTQRCVLTKHLKKYCKNKLL